MALILRSNDKAPVPRRVDLVLSCDGHQHGEGKEPIRTFTEGGYVANRHAAAAAGWVITDLGKVYCPTCKGRHRDDEERARQVRLPV